MQRASTAAFASAADLREAPIDALRDIIGDDAAATITSLNTATNTLNHLLATSASTQRIHGSRKEDFFFGVASVPLAWTARESLKTTQETLV